MENNTRYTAEAALDDVTATRAKTRSVAGQGWPLSLILPLAAVIPIGSLGFVTPGPWSYLFSVAAIALAVFIAVRMTVGMERRGVQLRIVDELKRSPLAIVGLAVSAIACFLVMVLADLNGWNPWTVPAAGLACGVIWLVLLLAVSRGSAARGAEAAQHEDDR